MVWYYFGNIGYGYMINVKFYARKRTKTPDNFFVT
jgi:hypothetical protein